MPGDGRGNPPGILWVAGVTAGLCCKGSVDCIAVSGGR